MEFPFVSSPHVKLSCLLVLSSCLVSRHESSIDPPLTFGKRANKFIFLNVAQYVTHTQCVYATVYVCQCRSVFHACSSKALAKHKISEKATQLARATCMLT